MSDDFKINDATYSGTKEVDQNLKFDTNLLQDWMHEHIPCLLYTSDAADE